MAKQKQYETHNFYCTKTGKLALALPRPCSKKREKLHLKKLFCYMCGKEHNCVECRDYSDMIIFKEKFERGDYIE